MIERKNEDIYNIYPFDSLIFNRTTLLLHSKFKVVKVKLFVAKLLYNHIIIIGLSIHFK